MKKTEVMELPGKSEYAAQQLSGSKSENNINPAVAGKSNDCRLLRAYTAAAEAQKNGDKKTDSHAVFKRLAETLITEEQAEFNYQEKLRNKNSEKVRKWRNKKKVTHQTEDETIARAQNEGEHLQHEKQALTERCELNTSFPEKQEKRTNSYHEQKKNRNCCSTCCEHILPLFKPFSCPSNL